MMLLLKEAILNSRRQNKQGRWLSDKENRNVYTTARILERVVLITCIAMFFVPAKEIVIWIFPLLFLLMYVISVITIQKGMLEKIRFDITMESCLFGPFVYIGMLFLANHIARGFYQALESGLVRAALMILVVCGLILSVWLPFLVLNCLYKRKKSKRDVLESGSNQSQA